jgi:hypothetical protein
MENADAVKLAGDRSVRQPGEYRMAAGLATVWERVNNPQNDPS